MVVMNKSGGLIEWQINYSRIFGPVLSNFLLLVCPGFTSLVSNSWVVCSCRTPEFQMSRVYDDTDK